MNKNTRILTVDDSASMRALLNHALTSNGFDVAQAEDGEVALEWLAASKMQDALARHPEVALPDFAREASFATSSGQSLG